MSNRKYLQRYVTSIPFEKSVYDGVNQLLPKGIDISDEINEFLKQRLTELKEQKNEIAEQKDYSAIRMTKGKGLDNNYKQQTILSFLCNTPKLDISKEINETDEIKKLAVYRDYGKVMMTVSQTKIMKVMKK